MAVVQSARSFTYTFFLPHGVKVEQIFALQAAVPKIRPIFKLVIFRHETLPSAIVPEVALFLPKGVKIELIFTLRAAVSKIRADFQN